MKTIQDTIEKPYKDLDLRRIEAVNKMVENGGASKGKAMIESGYTEAYAKNPKKFLKCKKTQELLGWIDYEIQQIAKRMDKTRDKARYKELSDSFVNLKKLSQLIGGQATERIEISDKDKKEIDAVFNDLL